MRPAIDLNADLGETVRGVATADDEAMFALVSSASIACGGHAGDDDSMRAAVEGARRHGVAVGAHPSYLDPEGFGRLALDVEPALLRAHVAEQLGRLVSAGAELRYVKPHGALYHRVCSDTRTAEAVADAVAELSERLGRAVPLLGLDGAIALAAERHGLPFFREAFLDRNYLRAGELVSRDQPGAVLGDAALVAARAVRLATEGVLEAVDGTPIRPRAASFCIHGDSPGAVAMARAVRTALDDADIEVRAPW